MMARSGDRAETAATREGASPTLATISWPASSSSRARPSRKRAESSPITMRTAAPPRRRCRGRPADTRDSSPPAAATRSASPANPAPGRTGAPPAPSSRTCTVTRLVQARDAQPDRRRRRVLDRVGQRLAGHVERGRRHVVGQVVRPDRSSETGTGTLLDQRGQAPARDRRRGCDGRSPCAICRSSATAEAQLDATDSSSRPSTSTVPSSRCRWASRSAMPSETSRCCAPSCRSRSSRRRSE